MSSSGNATVINDRYEIHKRVGRGGMADVFLAKDLLLDRQVAMKVLFPEFAVDPNFVERFRREAQSAANLSHPNIVNVYDWGKYEGTYFIAMEYVHGRTLAEILKTNDRLTPKQSAEIASEVAAALGFAHEAGLAHRDIKPANILIGANGQVKVADFGIARAMNAGTEANLTQAGSVMGTASYFSPEQAQGAQPDPRSDLYSLGIVMYEMVAGKPPFTGENPVSIAYKQVHDQPQPLNQIIDGVPRPFEAIVAKLLAKNPKLRYPTAHALRDDLRRFRNGEQVQALVAAAAVAPGIAPATPMAGHTVSTTPESAVSPTPRQPTVPGAPTEVVADQRSTDLAEYPPGASPDARYYQEGNTRTGWYALAAFIALIALAAGGVLLYQNLTEASSQTSQRTVGNYVTMNREQAVAAVEAQGLRATPVPEDNATVQPDVVHRTDPPAGQVLPSGDEVKLFYNPVPTLIPVPDVSRRDFPTAEKVLKDNGFQVVQETEVNDEVDEGLVIRTDPPADSLVSQINPITVFVSAGPDEELIPLNLIGETEEAVRAILEADPYNFDVRTEMRHDDEIEAGTVLSVVPESNTSVQPGSEVTLIVSQGPTQVVVPDVRGVTENEARDLLDAAELTVEVTYRELEPNDPNVGLVLEQSFTPDAQVDRGLTMAITVGRARAVVETDPPATTTAPTQPATTPAPTQAPTTTTTAAPTTTQPPTTTTTAAPSTNPGNG